MISVDLEVTNRCNAKCNFCPREATPHQGLMTPEIFDQALQQTVTLSGEFERRNWPGGIHVSLCGLGEPLLNRHIADFTRKVRDAGFHCAMSSNASLLDERRGQDLLDAGLQQICINVGERGDAYEEIYQLPWERTRDNILRFKDMAGDDCEVLVVLVDFKRDRAHLENQRAYWTDHGISAFQEFEIINRGGSLFVDHMQFEMLPELTEARNLLGSGGNTPVCGVPFGFMFVGYDGLYYLCCSDWEKKTPMGSVFDRTFLDLTRDKLRHVVDRQAVCRTCNLDPTNALTHELSAANAGQVDLAAAHRMAEALVAQSQAVLGVVEETEPGVTADIPNWVAGGRRTIPVTIR